MATYKNKRGLELFWHLKKGCLDRLNVSDDLSQNLGYWWRKYNFETCPLCRETHSVIQPCNSINQVTTSTIKNLVMTTHCNFPWNYISSFFQFIMFFINLSQIFITKDTVIHNTMESQKIEKRTLAKISLPKNKSKSVQVNFPKGNKNVQVNLSCDSSNIMCQTDVQTSSKSSQCIPSQQCHCSVQTENSEEYLDHGGKWNKYIKLFEMFWEHLKGEGQFDDFIKLAISLMRHQIPSDNMAWLSALHLGHYSRCKTTCNMKYGPKYAEFFSLLYLLFGSSILNILQGPGHFGSVVSQENARSKYDPAASKCNFAVPTVNRLRQIDFGYEKKIPPGTISKSIEICKSTPEKQFVLCFRWNEGFPRFQRYNWWWCWFMRCRRLSNSP